MVHCVQEEVEEASGGVQMEAEQHSAVQLKHSTVIRHLVIYRGHIFHTIGVRLQLMLDCMTEQDVE